MIESHSTEAYCCLSFGSLYEHLQLQPTRRLFPFFLSYRFLYLGNPIERVSRFQVVPVPELTEPSVKGQGRDNKRLPKYMKVKLKKRRRKRDRPGGRQAKYKGRPGRPGFYSNDSGLVLPASRQSTSRV